MATGVVLAAAAAHCGYPSFDFSSAGTGGGASSSSGAMGGGGKGSHASSSTVGSTSGAPASSSSGAGGSCMVQHLGGGTCEYLPGLQCGCTGTKKCSVVKEGTGESACVFSGATPSFAHCSTDADCAAGTWCNHSTQACQPICVNGSDCASQGGGQCEPAPQMGSTKPIPGLNVCAAHCDLVSAIPCGPGLNCVYQDALKEFECVFSTGFAKHTPCATDADCAQGLGCNDLGTGKQCYWWCTPATSSGKSGSIGCSGGLCFSVNPPIVKDGTGYGVCDN